MKTMKKKIRQIRNMRELDLVKENLEYRKTMHEDNIVKTSAKIVDGFTDKLKDLAFDLGMSMFTHLVSGLRKGKNNN